MGSAFRVVVIVDTVVDIELDKVVDNVASLESS